MRILELKNCSKDQIRSMLYRIDQQGFDAIQINNDNLSDLKSISSDACFRGITVILDVEEKNKPDSLIIRGVNGVVKSYNIFKLLKTDIRNFRLHDFDFNYEFITRLEGRTINKIYYNSDYKNVSNCIFDYDYDIAYLADYETYSHLDNSEFEKYRMFMTDLYTLLTGTYSNTLYSPIVCNGVMDTSFLDNDKIKQANKQLVRRREI